MWLCSKRSKSINTNKIIPARSLYFGTYYVLMFFSPQKRSTVGFHLCIYFAFKRFSDCHICHFLSNVAVEKKSYKGCLTRDLNYDEHPFAVHTLCRQHCRLQPLNYLQACSLSILKHKSAAITQEQDMNVLEGSAHLLCKILECKKSSSYKSTTYIFFQVNTFPW